MPSDEKKLYLRFHGRIINSLGQRYQIPSRQLRN